MLDDKQGVEDFAAKVPPCDLAKPGVPANYVHSAALCTKTLCSDLAKPVVANYMHSMHHSVHHTVN